MCLLRAVGEDTRHDGGSCDPGLRGQAVAFHAVEDPALYGRERPAESGSVLPAVQPEKGRVHVVRVAVAGAPWKARPVLAYPPDNGCPAGSPCYSRLPAGRDGEHGPAVSSDGRHGHPGRDLAPSGPAAARLTGPAGLCTKKRTSFGAKQEKKLRSLYKNLS